MKHLKTIVTLSLSVIVMTGLLSFSMQKSKPWPVPDNYKIMKNPKKSDQASLDIGKAEWNKSCKSCHGSKGLGDGPKAKGLKTPSGDFSVDLKGQTDGSIFYKTRAGRGDMPKYEGKITDGDIWHLVNYMKTMIK